MDFEPFQKLSRLSRRIVVSEKLDGTNACIAISDDGLVMQAGSRTRWITPDDDNFGFAKWAQEHGEELLKLGPGRHFGEWWGRGIQRGYGLTERRFSLFNTERWGDPAARPACCHVVPVLYDGMFGESAILEALENLALGSAAAPGFDKPEGIVIYHTAARVSFKKTILGDESPKGKA